MASSSFGHHSDFDLFLRFQNSLFEQFVELFTHQSFQRMRYNEYNKKDSTHYVQYMHFKTLYDNYSFPRTHNRYHVNTGYQYVGGRSGTSRAMRTGGGGRYWPAGSMPPPSARNCLPAKEAAEERKAAEEERRATEAAEEDRKATKEDRKSTRLNSSHSQQSRMPSSA